MHCKLDKPEPLQAFRLLFLKRSSALKKSAHKSTCYYGTLTDPGTLRMDHDQMKPRFGRSFIIQN